ncbi:MAG: alpha/beta hydrolase [Proteobacteria bacterium]|nr:alpha/beta hydrolase [Pseudomonadota bacterium]
MFLHGFKSDKSGTKAAHLDAWCAKHNVGFTCFDLFGHGESSGAFTDGSIGRWIEDTLFVLDHLTKGPQILIGSSLGGWLMLHAAMKRTERIQAILGIAAAPDFTERLIWDALKPEEKKQIMEKGSYDLAENCNDTQSPGYTITRRLIEEARNHLLLDRASIPITCPARFIHGMEDKDVPYHYSTMLAERLQSEDVRVTLAKKGDHRMSSLDMLELLETTLSDMLK